MIASRALYNAAQSTDKTFLTREELEEHCESSVRNRLQVDHPDFKLIYKGCILRFPFTRCVSEIETFQANLGDICIASYPKTGQTMMGAMALMTLRDGDPMTFQTGAPLKMKVPYLEDAYPRNGSFVDPIFPIRHLKSLEGPRLYGTHLNATALPEQLLQTAKILFVYRNPKDTIISAYHFMLSGATVCGRAENLSDFIQAFIAEDGGLNPYFDHLESFWSRRSQSNIHVTSFETVVTDRTAATRKLGLFLGKCLTDTQVGMIVFQCSFQEMKKNPLTDCSQIAKSFGADANANPFLRAGKIGNWLDYLSVEQNEQIDNWVEHNFARRPALSGLTFQYEP
ncbi:putative Sulfotransferase 1A2 [Hypsibius exemplaris]|uniref:Sulfotransferase 1A2 n=1 Tax=Hypsibius exemplaris TaxID=2072580 RepID=A0A1W0WNF9_HYPEX|nr:putative Sulfotransferase 1A2 [Hypsibius exemplaris]